MTDEHLAALEKLERINEICGWLKHRKLAAHRMGVEEIAAIISNR